MLSKEEKERFLKALEADSEFRYAVAGLLGLKEILDRLNFLEESIKRLWEGQRKLWEEVRALRRAQERLTVSFEEEAREVVGGRPREALGVEVALDRLYFDDEELLEKVERLSRERSHLLRRRIVKVIYASVATPEALKLALERRVWIATIRSDLTPLVVEER